MSLRDANLRRATRWLIAVVGIVAIAYDVLAAITREPRDTISAVVADVTDAGWFAIPLGLGALVGHLFAPAQLGHDGARLAAFFSLAAVVIAINVVLSRYGLAERLVLEVHPVLWSLGGMLLGSMLWSLRRSA